MAALSENSAKPQTEINYDDVTVEASITVVYAFS